MKALEILFSAMLIALPGAPAHAQMKMEDMGKMEKSSKPSATHKAVGVVKKVDSGKGVVTLAHEPVKSLKLPAMTMDFQVRDKSRLAKLKPEQKIEFEFVQQGDDYVITAVK